MAGANFVLWGLLAASAVYWAMQLTLGHKPSLVPVLQRSPAPADPAAVARLLGASPAAAAPAPSLVSRFALQGVVASRRHQGAALISIDGKPAKPFRVNAALEEGIVLKSVQGRRAVLAASASGPALLTLDLPVRK